MGRLFDSYFQREIRAERRRRLDRYKPVVVEDANPILKSFEAVWQETMTWLLRKRDSLYSLDRNAPSRMQVDSLIGSLEKAKANPDSTPESIKSDIENTISDYESMANAEAPGEIKEFLDRTVEALRDTMFQIGSEPESFDSGGGGGGGSTPGGEGEEGSESEDGDKSEEEEPSELDQIASDIFPSNEEPEPKK